MHFETVAGFCGGHTGCPDSWHAFGSCTLRVRNLMCLPDHKDHFLHLQEDWLYRTAVHLAVQSTPRCIDGKMS
jgi:hypothetical protein